MYVPALRLAACAAMALCVLALLPPSAVAQDDNPVVATVNGEEIRRDEVIEAILRLPPQQVQQLPPEQLIPIMARQLATRRLMSARGYAENLQDTDEVKERMAEAEAAIVRVVWLEQAIDARMTEESVAAAYGEFIVANPPVEEVRARHILIATEDEGKALIVRLQDGEDFAALAMEASTGPTGPTGGDLGYFTKDRMVPEFAEAAFALQPGQFSETPVQSQFGWHVILVEDRRMTEPPSLEEMRDQLESQLANEYFVEIEAELLEGAEIVMYDANGEPIEN